MAGLIILGTEKQPDPFRCRLCQRGFPTPERLARHCSWCADDQRGRIEHDSLRTRMPGFMEPWDPEQAAWMRQTGRFK